MDELVNVLGEILYELKEMNSKLDDIKGTDVNSIDDVCDKLDLIDSNLSEIKGMGLYNSISEVCDKLEEIKGTGVWNSLSDVCDKLDSLDTSISMLG